MWHVTYRVLRPRSKLDVARRMGLRSKLVADGYAIREVNEIRLLLTGR